MKKWKKLGVGLLAGAAALTVVAQSAVANPDNPTFVSGGFGSVTSARATNITAAGLVNLGPLQDAKCTPGEQKDNHAVDVNIPNIATITGLEAKCSVSTNGRTASAVSKVAAINLFNGKVKIDLLESDCYRTQTLLGGRAVVGSTYGSLVTDQNYSRNGSGAIVIPGIATVAVDVNNLGNTHASSDLIVITLLNTLQTIVISSCSLTHQSLG
jgi:hypothetical protein